MEENEKKLPNPPDRIKIALEASFQREKSLEERNLQLAGELEKLKSAYSNLHQQLKQTYDDQHGLLCLELAQLKKRNQQLEITEHDQNVEIIRLQNEMNQRIKNHDLKINVITRDLGRKIEQLQFEKDTLNGQCVKLQYEKNKLSIQNQQLKKEIQNSNERYCDTSELPHAEIDSLRELRFKLQEEMLTALKHQEKLEAASTTASFNANGSQQAKEPQVLVEPKQK